MKKVIGTYEVELEGSMVYIRNAASGELINAKPARPFEALAKFNKVCELIGIREGVKVQPIIVK